jgi:LacI family transcriptional regulator
VEKAIADMGYRPSQVARSLVNQRSYTIGVILAGLQYIGVSTTLNGIAEECEGSGFSLVIKELPSFDTPDIVPVIMSLIAHQVDGIIFAAPELNDNVRLTQSQIPLSCPPIIFLKSRQHPKFPTISIDNHGGAYRAVDYLLSIGKKEVGLITGPLDWLESRQRKQGWLDALSQKGIQVNDDHWAEGNWSSSSGEFAFKQLIRKYPQMDSVFVSNDQMALGVLHFTSVHGIQVPNQLAVIGFDDITEAAYFSPALSTVTHPLRELGIQAVKSLLNQIENPGAMPLQQNITLQTHLIIRDSTPIR